MAAFEKASGLKINYKILDRRAGALARSFANAEKAEKLLGFKTQLDLNKMCEDIWRWQSGNPNGFDGE